MGVARVSLDDRCPYRNKNATQLNGPARAQLAVRDAGALISLPLACQASFVASVAMVANAVDHGGASSISSQEDGLQVSRRSHEQRISFCRCDEVSQHSAGPRLVGAARDHSGAGRERLGQNLDIWDNATGRQESQCGF